MTRRKWKSNAERQAQYRARKKLKEQHRWETIFKKDKTIQPLETQATKPIELEDKELELKYSELQTKINYLHSLKNEPLEFNMTKEELVKLLKDWSSINCHNCSEQVYAFLDTCPFCNTIVDWDWQ